MKVLEIKNNLVKIAYDVKDNLALSSFVIIEDVNTRSEERRVGTECRSRWSPYH